MKLISWFLSALFYSGASSRHYSGAHFIKSFISNEQKPSFLILNDLCWKRYRKVKLLKEISKIGCRSSESFDLTSVHLYHSIVFLLDLGCPNTEEILQNATSKSLFRSPFRWLVLGNLTDEIIQEQPILADSDVVFAEKTEYGYIMTELHKFSVNASFIKNIRGHYSNGVLKDIRPHREIFKRRRDMMGHPLTMANVIQDSNTTQYHLPREDGMEPEYDSISKICWMEARLAFQMLNATPRYIFSHRWGYKQNGQWSGMIDDLHTGRADLGTNCLVSDKERLDVVAYTDMVAPFRVRFVFRQPPLSYVSNIFSLPFSAGVWIAVAFCAAVSTVTLYLESLWEAAVGSSSTQLYGIGDALLLTMSAVSQQGCALEPRKFSGRVMTWILFAALMALYAAYSANIVVLLQAPSNSIGSLAQLANSKVTLAANDVDYNHFVFKLYKEPVRVTIYKRIDPEKGKGQFYGLNEGVERIREGLFAFHSIVEPVYRRIEKTFLETEKCDLHEVDFLNGFDPFVPVKKDSPYIDLLRVTTLVESRLNSFKRIRESGIQSALEKRMLVPKPRCSNKGSAFSSVGLLDLRPVLLFMVYGIGVSLLILVIEILHCRLYRKCRQRKNVMWIPNIGKPYMAN